MQFASSPPYSSVSPQRLQKSGGKCQVPQLREVYAVVCHEYVPAPGVGEADTQPIGQAPTALGKRAGVINELLALYPLLAAHRRRG